MGKKEMSDDILEREVIDVIKEKYEEIFQAEKKVADYILKHPRLVVDYNVSELAKESGVSDATVVRMCNHIGYIGYHQLRIQLARDMGRKQYENLKYEKNKNVVEKVFQSYAKKMIEIGKSNGEDIMQECVNLLKTCKVAHLLAVGNTAPLAQYMGFRLGRLGIKCTYNVAPEYFLNHVNLADEGDILIAITQSGTSKAIVRGMELGREKGLKSIAITAFENSPVSHLADFVLLSTSREEAFTYYKGYAHLNETAVVDALLEFVTNEELIQTTHADKPEIILSDNKM